MRKYSTGSKLLLITPVLYILLQVALSLHHHHSESYHDDKDSLHSFPKAFTPDHVNLDTLISLTSAVLLIFASWLRIHSPERLRVAITALVSAPPQSRAPPTLLFS